MTLAGMIQANDSVTVKVILGIYLISINVERNISRQTKIFGSI